MVCLGMEIILIYYYDLWIVINIFIITIIFNVHIDLFDSQEAELSIAVI